METYQANFADKFRSSKDCLHIHIIINKEDIDFYIKLLSIDKKDWAVKIENTITGHSIIFADWP